MKITKKLFILWITVMFLETFTCSLVYIIVQQTLRLGANELPMQLAIDTSIKLQEGLSVNDTIPADKVDISKSLSTFVMIYDNNKNLVATSGIMGSSNPEYPKGVLNYVDQKGEDRVTWQPQTGLRFASIVIKYKYGYIVAARSLKEIEKLIDLIGIIVLSAWFACSVFSALVFGTIYFLMKAQQ
jgi:hypothetical protein